MTDTETFRRRQAAIRAEAANLVRGAGQMLEADAAIRGRLAATRRNLRDQAPERRGRDQTGAGPVEPPPERG